MLLFQESYLTGVAATQKSDEGNGLQLIAVYGFIPVNDKNDETLLTCSIYLKNTSNETSYLVTGARLGPIVSPGEVRYITLLDDGGLGVAIKPSPGALDITELKPGEIVSLKKFKQELGKADPSDLQITYSIDKELKRFYPEAWVGRIKLRFSLR
jgi:hypothetical protein